MISSETQFTKENNMTFLVLMLKGFVIGIAFIVPGVSGGTVALYLGLYDKLLKAIGDIFKNFKESLKLLVPVFLGAAISVIGLAWLLGLLIDKNSFVVLMLFIGLIIGGIPALLDQIAVKEKIKSAIIPFVLSFLIVVGLLFADKLLSPTARGDFSISAGSFFLVFALGLVASVTMVIPGVSGSALLMMLGYYTAIVTNVVGGIFDFSRFGYNMFILIPFALGIAVGIILTSKFLGKMLSLHPVESYGAIIGFVLASVIGIFLEIRDPASGLTHSVQTPIVDDFGGFIQANPWSLVFGLLAFGIGFFVTYWFLPRSQKPKT
jgi:putative membrane protein